MMELKNLQYMNQDDLMIIEPGKISPHFSTSLRVEVLRVEVGKGLAFKVNLEEILWVDHLTGQIVGIWLA